MGIGPAIVFIAAVPAYLAGGVALMMGAGWLLSLAVLSATGVALVVFTVLTLIVRGALPRSARKPAPLAQPTR